MKLLAFGEDYGQYLERADSESSSMLSGFEPAESRKRRPLVVCTQYIGIKLFNYFKTIIDELTNNLYLQHANRDEMADSDSDREELNYLLRQSSSQLRFIDAVFRGLLEKVENSSETPTKYVSV